MKGLRDITSFGKVEAEDEEKGLEKLQYLGILLKISIKTVQVL